MPRETIATPAIATQDDDGGASLAWQRFVDAGRDAAARLRADGQASEADALEADLAAIQQHAQRAARRSRVLER